jgi:hypothetical protein
MTTQCDIELASVTISNNRLTCSGQDLQLDNNGLVNVVGSTQTNSITVVDSRVTILLTTVSIRASLPFVVRGSNVTVIESGLSQLTATGLNFCGLNCNESSSILFMSASPTSRITSQGATYGCGIGAGWFQSCHTLHFVNGTYNGLAGYDGGGGIGCGSGPSSLSSIVVDGATLEGYGHDGAGIGSGPGAESGSDYSGGSRVGSILVHNGKLNGSVSFWTSGSGIGASLGTELGDSTVGTILLENGLFIADRAGFSGIGSGGGAGGTSSVDSILIYDGIFVVSGEDGAGIGSGSAQRAMIYDHELGPVDGDCGSSSVGVIAIYNGSIRAKGTYGAGIGSGSARDGANCTVGTISIHGGTITAEASTYAAGIGLRRLFICVGGGN